MNEINGQEARFSSIFGLERKLVEQVHLVFMDFYSFLLLIDLKNSLDIFIDFLIIKSRHQWM